MPVQTPVHTLIRSCSVSSDQPLLQRGSFGEAVSTMQRLLLESPRGFDYNEIYAEGDTYGAALRAVVVEFQRQVFLEIDGIVGPNTWKALCVDGPVDQSLIRPGDRSEAVRQAQHRLYYGGYYRATIDGDFGPIMQAAVVQFQSDYGLSPDGIVGPLSWDALSRV